MTLATQLRRYWRELAAILALVAVAIPVFAYIADKQRLHWPWENRLRVRAEFTAAQGVSPGQGQQVTVSGVVVGEIKGVTVRDGLALVELSLDPDEVPRVHADATAALRPRTALSDMSVQLDPGSPSAPVLGENGVIDSARTSGDVKTDEALGSLDADSRAYLAVLLNEGGRALHDRGEALRHVLRTSRPAFASTRRLTGALAARHRQLRRLVTDLRTLAAAAAGRAGEIGTLVDGADEVFGALAKEDAALSGALRRLPATLRAARDALGGSAVLAAELRPALDALGPAARALPAALRDARPLLSEATPALRDDLRPFVRATRPVARDLRPAVQDLRAVTPALRTTFSVVARGLNELAHNPSGDEEGYLFWLAWFAHNGNSMLSTQDANSSVWRGLLLLSCSSSTLPDPLSGVLELLATLPVCPEAAK